MWNNKYGINKLFFTLKRTSFSVSISLGQQVWVLKNNFIAVMLLYSGLNINHDFEPLGVFFLSALQNSTAFRFSILTRLWFYALLCLSGWLMTNQQKCHFIPFSLYFCFPFGFEFIRMRSMKSWNFRILCKQCAKKIFASYKKQIQLCKIKRKTVSKYNKSKIIFMLRGR